MNTARPIDQVKLALALDAFCSVLGEGRLWTEDGPTEKAAALRSAVRLGKRTRLLVHASWAVWNQSSDVSLVEVLDMEDADLRPFIGLLSALMDSTGLALEAWTAGRKWRAQVEHEERRAGGTHGR